MTLRNPQARRNGCAVSFIASDPAAEAKVISPLCTALNPNPIWSIIGSRNGNAPTAIRASVPE